MTNPYRHSLPELVSRYRLEPDLRDIFVEGTSDQSLLNWFFSQADIATVRIYPISSVHITNSFPVTDGGGGEKGRVLTLGLALANALPIESRNVVCAIDRDLIGISIPSPVCSKLVTTDYGCIECYALNADPMSKFFELYFENHLPTPLLESFYEVLSAVFVLRAAKFELNFTIGWVEDFTDCLNFDGNAIEFEQSKFLKKIANKAGGAFSEEQLVQKVEEIQLRSNHPPLCLIHKRDALRLLCWIGRKLGCDPAICRPEPTVKALFLSLDYNFVRTFDLFSYLTVWAA